ncbi:MULTISPECIES: hypothetical protein [Pseudomonas]|jgi:hypothetical protein|uniref:Uncharacterized protein n=2 Tax=Pseudomonas TaxID=286 RepID=A0ACC5MG81_9PSED|nr:MULTISPECIES: hypothetical protein [Pseudomonas]ATE79584.1 hypothetical protein CNN82_25355 [Pseudomonas frederiksbergensis]MBB2887693.1 hypothetical protein [Pseudomonas umsongensis]
MKNLAISQDIGKTSLHHEQEFGMTTENVVQESKGTLIATKSYEGPINASVVSYREGSRDGITLYGQMFTDAENSRGIQIEFFKDAEVGVALPVGGNWPKVITLSYFRQEGSHRTQYTAQAGDLTLKSFDYETSYASGTFKFWAEVDGGTHEFEGNFDIRLIPTKQ